MTQKNLLFISHAHGRTGWRQEREKSSRKESIWKDSFTGPLLETASQALPLTSLDSWHEAGAGMAVPTYSLSAMVAAQAVSPVIQGRKISQVNSHPSREKPKAMRSSVSSKMGEVWEGNKPLFQLNTRVCSPHFPHQMFQQQGEPKLCPGCTATLLFLFLGVLFLLLVRIWSLKTTTKWGPTTHKREGHSSHNSNFKIVSFQKLCRMWNGGEMSPVGWSQCSCSSLKLLLTPSGLVSSRKFFKQNSAFSPLSSCSGPLSPPLCSSSQPPLSSGQDGH